MEREAMRNAFGNERSDNVLPLQSGAQAFAERKRA
jgi:hypothetical protein